MFLLPKTDLPEAVCPRLFAILCTAASDKELPEFAAARAVAITLEGSPDAAERAAFRELSLIGDAETCAFVGKQLSVLNNAPPLVATQDVTSVVIPRMEFLCVFLKRPQMKRQQHLLGAIERGRNI